MPKEYERTIHEVTDRLREENIFLLKENELDEEQQTFVSDFFRRQLSGFVSPVWLSAVKQLTEATDENIYLAVKCKFRSSEGICYTEVTVSYRLCSDRASGFCLRTFSFVCPIVKNAVI